MGKALQEQKGKKSKLRAEPCQLPLARGEGEPAFALTTLQHNPLWNTGRNSTRAGAREGGAPFLSRRAQRAGEARLSLQQLLFKNPREEGEETLLPMWLEGHCKSRAGLGGSEVQSAVRACQPRSPAVSTFHKRLRTFTALGLTFLRCCRVHPLQ